MDLSGLADSFITSVRTEVTKTGALVVRIGLEDSGRAGAVLILTDVTRVCIDGDDLHSFVGEILVRRLPRYGPWPEEARHILGHHTNEAEVVWLRLEGPTTIEVLARELRVEVDGCD